MSIKGKWDVQPGCVAGTSTSVRILGLFSSLEAPAQFVSLPVSGQVPTGTRQPGRHATAPMQPGQERGTHGGLRSCVKQRPEQGLHSGGPEPLFGDTKPNFRWFMHFLKIMYSF